VKIRPIWRKNGVMTQNEAKLCKILIITLGFEKNANFFRRENVKNRRQL
jgi:hypothetical protein